MCPTSAISFPRSGTQLPRSRSRLPAGSTRWTARNRRSGARRRGIGRGAGVDSPCRRDSGRGTGVDSPGRAVDTGSGRPVEDDHLDLHARRPRRSSSRSRRRPARVGGGSSARSNATSTSLRVRRCRALRYRRGTRSNGDHAEAAHTISVSDPDSPESAQKRNIPAPRMFPLVSWEGLLAPRGDRPRVRGRSFSARKCPSPGQGRTFFARK